MINYTPPVTISGGTSKNGASLNGIDLLTSMQLMLVQEYDNQLNDLGKQIKGTMNAKKAYRQDIQELQKLLNNSGGKKKIDGKEQEYVIVKDADYDPAKETKRHTVDLNTGDLIEGNQDFGKLLYVTGSNKNGQREVTKESIESKIELVKGELDSLNEQSELLSLSLQSLTNQRKIALETVSNLVNKQHDSLATITRNVKG